ncbi:MAG: restriction endonuclease subunit S [Patescibacteria group bacterium]
MNKPNQVQITCDQKGRELVMVRVDKTLKDFMSEEPSSRWSPAYWHPKYDDLFKNIETKILNEYILDIQGGGGGSHFSSFLGDKWDEKGKYASYLHISSIMETGINWVDSKSINERTYRRLKSKQLEKNDILLSNKGTVGKSVVIYRDFPKTIVGDTRIIKVKNLNPYFLCIYFKTSFGKKLSERYKSGVASEGTTMEQLKIFPIPTIKDSIQVKIEEKYKNISVFHDHAMKAKKNRNEKSYRENIDIAEKMLKELILKTEAVITGELNDIV